VYRPDPCRFSMSCGWLPADVGQFRNWWQLRFSPSHGSQLAIVEARVSAYAQAAAMLATLGETRSDPRGWEFVEEIRGCRRGSGPE
jgi:hypothetical protein